jgi:hypothetical protein
MIVYFGQFFENYQSSLQFWATFFLQLRLCNNLDKNVLGYILGDFLENSSGHPARRLIFLNSICRFGRHSKALGRGPILLATPSSYAYKEDRKIIPTTAFAERKCYFVVPDIFQRN